MRRLWDKPSKSGSDRFMNEENVRRTDGRMTIPPKISKNRLLTLLQVSLTSSPRCPAVPFVPSSIFCLPNPFICICAREVAFNKGASWLNNERISLFVQGFPRNFRRNLVHGWCYLGFWCHAKHHNSVWFESYPAVQSSLSGLPSSLSDNEICGNFEFCLPNSALLHLTCSVSSWRNSLPSKYGLWNNIFWAITWISW